MIILIAESKTMLESGSIVSEEQFKSNTPAEILTASEIMRKVGDMTAQEISDTIKVSDKMAVRILKMAYDFPLHLSGLPAIEAFTGVVFKALGYSTLSPDAKRYVDENVRIISSLYGWLRPSDIIKPYRTEFSSPIAPEGKSLASFQRKSVTINLVNFLREKSISNILDLMPSDASKCIDKKLVKRFAKIWKIDFKEIMPGGAFRTPHAGKLKALRGQLLREIAIRNIHNPKDLLQLETSDMLPLGTPDYPDHIAFCVE